MHEGVFKKLCRNWGASRSSWAHGAKIEPQSLWQRKEMRGWVGRGAKKPGRSETRKQHVSFSLRGGQNLKQYDDRTQRSCDKKGCFALCLRPFSPIGQAQSCLFRFLVKIKNEKKNTRTRRKRVMVTRYTHDHDCLMLHRVRL